MSTRRGRLPGEHPENDLTSDAAYDADYANLRPPEPASFDELADAPDPLTIAAANTASTKQAIWFTVGVLAGSILVAGALAGIFHLLRPEHCADAELAAWLCTPGHRVTYAVLASILPAVGMFGSAIIMVRKLRRYVRWRPWMGAFWILVMNFMWWGITNIQVLLSPTH